MPWDESDAAGKTKKASTPKRRRQWSAVANSALASGASEGSAIRQANTVVKKQKAKDKKVRHRGKTYNIRDRSKL